MCGDPGADPGGAEPAGPGSEPGQADFGVPSQDFGPSQDVGYAPGTQPGGAARSADFGRTDIGAGPGSTPSESLAERSGISPSNLADMINVGMNLNNPIDVAIARGGIAIGLPPDPAKSTHMGVMSAITAPLSFAGLPVRQGLHAVRAAKAGKYGKALGYLGAAVTGIPTEVASLAFDEDEEIEGATPASVPAGRSFAETQEQPNIDGTAGNEIINRRSRYRYPARGYLIASGDSDIQPSNSNEFGYDISDARQRPLYMESEQASGSFRPWWREGYLYRG